MNRIYELSVAKNISFLNKAYILLFIIIAFSSCEEVIDLELRGKDDPALIVEAEVVDVEGYSFVRLGESLDFYDPSEEPKVSGAIVSVTDQNGNKMDFLESSEEAGLYLPQDSNYKGVVGNTYNLRIEYKNEAFTSESTIFPTTDIDSVQIRFVPESRFQDEGYYLFFYAKEPQETRDYYFWRNYVNDTLIYDNAGDLLYSADDAVGENIDGLQLPYAYELGDTVRLEQYSITKEAYDYYDDLVDVVFNDGGLFSPPPVNY
ncbi:DUF4249 domain-containing protein [Bernardetia sp.]|uniref:DUF4249 domain-containing protein n=1 Tax=Bernardetia sp. TaxID=1937974 RepID=UPI0025C061CC|nr:DUF4249 domain-containing protein [Bernardetia sp.]